MDRRGPRDRVSRFIRRVKSSRFVAFQARLPLEPGKRLALGCLSSESEARRRRDDILREAGADATELTSVIRDKVIKLVAKNKWWQCWIKVRGRHEVQLYSQSTEADAQAILRNKRPSQGGYFPATLPDAIKRLHKKFPGATVRESFIESEPHGKQDGKQDGLGRPSYVTLMMPEDFEYIESDDGCEDAYDDVGD